MSTSAWRRRGTEVVLRPVAELISGFGHVDTKILADRIDQLDRLQAEVVGGVSRCLGVAQRVVHRDLVAFALDAFNLQHQYDGLHTVLHGDDVPAAVRTFGGRIAHIHVKDASGTPDDYQFPPLGQGDVDFSGFIGAVQETGYRGVLSVEYEANAFGYQQTEEEILGGSLRFVQRLIA